MSQPPNQSWDPNADNPGQGYPPQQPPQPGYGNPPPPPQPGYGAQPPPGYGAQPPPPGYGAQPPPPAPGYGPPAGPPGYGPPPGAPGYPPPGPAAPPPGYASGEDKTYALVAHFGGAAGTLISGGVLAFVGPMIALLAKGTSPTVRAHATNALNFFIPVSAAGLLLFIAQGCTGFVFTSSFGLYALVNGLLWLLHAVVWVIGIVFGIIGGLRANEGAVYKYPLSLSIIK